MVSSVRAIIATLCLGLLAGTSPVHGSERPRERVRKALSILLRAPTGRDLVGRAQTLWNEAQPMGILAHLEPSSVSRTDAVLTRHFHPGTGEERRERKVTIHLRTDQEIENLVLDLAHELVHATSRPAWDPYDPELTAAKYIRASIEGEGGEVSAVVAECRTALELSGVLAGVTDPGAANLQEPGPSFERCHGYLEATRGIASDRVKRDFYRVGHWSSELVSRLGTEINRLPLLSPDPPKLYSSTGRTPYPLALLHEFEEITHAACENTRRRVQSAAERKPSSVHANEFLHRRCR